MPVSQADSGAKDMYNVEYLDRFSMHKRYLRNCIILKAGRNARGSLARLVHGQFGLARLDFSRDELTF
jgi:hypothetical protein